MSIRTKKLVAWGMLVYALFCFAAPDLCRGDDAVSTPLASTGFKRDQVANLDKSVPASSQELDQDDCFCCCSHIAPSTPTLAVGMIEAVFERPVSIPNFVPILAGYFFHPPRP